MKNRSMTRRLIFSITATVIISWLVATAAGMFVMQDEFGEIFDGALQATTERLTPLVVDDLLQNEEIPDARRLQNLNESTHKGYLTYQIRDKTGKVLLHSHDVSPTPFPAPLKRGFFKDDVSRYYTVPAADNTIFVQVADSLAHRNEAAVEGGLALLLPVLVLIPVSIIGVWLIIRRSIAPVNDLRQAIACKDRGNLAPIELVTLPRELQPIVLSVNRLLERLRSALKAEREFTANSAHELRTPLAGALAQTQMLKSELRSTASRSRVTHIEASLQKLIRLVEKLMQLARAEAKIGTSNKSADLGNVLQLVIEDFRRASEANDRIQYTQSNAAKLLRPVSEDAFAIVLRNLIENALIHGDPARPVSIRFEENSSIHILNDGPLLSAEELALIRQRFSRGRTTSPGSGLGLSIATELVSQMDATLELKSPATGSDTGFEAILRFNA